MDRMATAAIAIAGLLWAVRMLSPTATAETAAGLSPGVPCVGILQDLATSPPNVAQFLPSSTSSVPGALPPSVGPGVPSATVTPAAGVVEDLSAPAEAAPVTPAAAVIPAADVVEAALPVAAVVPDVPAAVVTPPAGVVEAVPPAAAAWLGPFHLRALPVVRHRQRPPLRLFPRLPLYRLLQPPPLLRRPG
jgi:hypothetical protein